MNHDCLKCLDDGYFREIVQIRQFCLRPMASLCTDHNRKKVCVTPYEEGGFYTKTFESHQTEKKNNTFFIVASFILYHASIDVLSLNSYRHLVPSVDGKGSRKKAAHGGVLLFCWQRHESGRARLLGRARTHHEASGKESNPGRKENILFERILRTNAKSSGREILHLVFAISS